ncbi:MAG: DUF4097 family beta strand repeat-containing protein [Planctomycetota bacterium]|jgi:DUF4097 and DUF4098 domain-containing protein YvlB
MRKEYALKVFLVCLLSLMVFLPSCAIQFGWGAPRAKHERIVALSAPMQAGSELSARTHNGSIKAIGVDVADCNVTATIIGRANSDEEALRIAEQTEVKLKPDGNGLIVKIEKPATKANQSVSVSFDITLPDQADLEFVTHNGQVKIENITGLIDAVTHNGRVTAKHLTGTTLLKTHNGRIDCKEVSGDTKLKTHNGKINAVYSQNAEPVCNAELITHNGGINFTAPPDISAVARISTHNGSINTDLPITVKGKLSKRSISGTIGTGQGNLHLETHNGSIRIK